MANVFTLFIFLFIAQAHTFAEDKPYTVNFHSEHDHERNMHPIPNFSEAKQSQPVEDSEFWRIDAQNRLRAKLQNKEIEAVARNVIFYLGDGMSIQTVTAARIMKGQKVDNLPFGEEAELYMDSFPFTGTSKTFCADAQVADSACSATAYLCGIKSNDGTIGVTTDVLLNSCEAQADPSNHVSSILAWAQAEGKSTGVVTTTRITHASPSGTFAHIAHRNWENDAAITSSGQDAELCDDIAEQLILNSPGRNFNVILGGGRTQFLPGTVADPEYPLVRGLRRDGKNLIQEWVDSKDPSTSKYVTSRTDLLQIDTNTTDYLLGLFEADHIRYLDEQAAHDDPSLEEMVETAVKILSKNPQGFFLFIEGGRIDHAHHANLIQRSLWETIEFDKAIKKGDDMTLDNETLIVITSDHAHVMHFAGYPDRGNDILRYMDPPYGVRDDLPYNTLGYGNGPTGLFWGDPRPNITEGNFDSSTYLVPAPVPLTSESHGGDDVLIFAKGPYAHLLAGTHQQSYIPHAIGYAACVGSGNYSDLCTPSRNYLDNGGGQLHSIFPKLLSAILIFFVNFL